MINPLDNVEMRKFAQLSSFAIKSRGRGDVESFISHRHSRSRSFSPKKVVVWGRLSFAIFAADFLLSSVSRFILITGTEKKRHLPFRPTVNSSFALTSHNFGGRRSLACLSWTDDCLLTGRIRVDAGGVVWCLPRRNDRQTA